jgi:tRNA nucleotidyltransferase (CCA-adding enzyme)
MTGAVGAELPCLLGKSLSKRAIAVVEKAALMGEASDKDVFLVGGTVRDILLGKKSYDVDMAVEGDAIALGKVIASSSGAKIKCYTKPGTCTLLFPLEGISGIRGRVIRLDIASSREEMYSSPGAFPDTRPGSIENDLARRDFTINAMAIGVNGKNFGVLLDPMKGSDDLTKGVIRALHDNSFLDDPARIFRAVRFEKRLSFAIEKHTERLIRHSAETGMLRKLRKNRIKEEWRLVLKEKQHKKCIIRLRDLLKDEMNFVLSVVG